jgi:hypothetical protein
MKTRSRALLALTGLVVTLALIYAASASVVKSATSVAARRDAKYNTAERLVFYRLKPGEEMRVKVPDAAEELRLVTHLVLPEGTTYAPERQYQYGVKTVLRAPEGILLEKPLFTRTRQSKAQPQEDGTWLQESAFATDASMQVTDEREFLLRLPEQRPEHSVLYLRPAGTQGTLLVRVYVRTHRRLPLLSSRRAAEERAEERVEKATFLPFEKLSADTRHKLADEKWERLSAEGEAGTDYFIEPVYRTPFRLPLVEVANSVQERLGAGSAVALNVTGPTQAVLWLWSTAPDTEGGTPTPAGPVVVRSLGPTGAERTWEIPALGSGAPMSHVLDVPAGSHTLSVHNVGAEDLRYTLEGPATAWLAPEELRANARPEARVALLPDQRRMEAFVTGPGCATLDLTVDEAMDAAGRLVRLDARQLGVTGRGEEAPAKVVLDVLDARGRVLSQTGMDVAATASPFESADVPLLPGRVLPCSEAQRKVSADLVTGEVTDRPTPVSMPATARLFLPAGARTVRVQASRPTAVLLSTFLPAQGELASVAPYLEDGLEGVRWKNAPLELRHWYPMRPGNVTELTRRGARLELLSQVRLEPVGLQEVASSGSGDTVVLKPQGRPLTMEVLEPVQGVNDPARALSTLLTPGQPVRARFDARAPSRPELRLALEDSRALGTHVEVMLDGQPFHQWTVRSTRTRELLPPLPPGEHEVLLRTDAEGLTATLNRPPVGDSGLGSRTVYRMDGEGLVVPVRKPGTGAVTVNIVLYTSTPDSGAQQVSLSLDDGQPLRRGGVLLPRVTRATRVVPLPPSTRAPATPAGRPQVRWYAHTFSVTLGEDIAPGPHRVRVVPLGQDEGAMWARFFMFGQSASAPAQEWNRNGWELEDSL